MKRSPREVTDAEVAFYRENGWVKLDGFVNRELAAELLQVAQEVMGEEPESDGEFSFVERGEAASPEAKPGGRIRNTGAWQDYHYIARDDRREPFRSLVFSKETGHQAQRLIGRDVEVRYSGDLIACKMPAGREGGEETPWHQDFMNQPFDRYGPFSFWIALDEVPPERGSMRFLSGSQREGPLGRTRVDGKSVVEAYPRLLERYEVSPPLHLHPGDATAHSTAVAHSAPLNTTERPRWALIVAYFPGDALYTGAPNHNFDGIGLTPNNPFDHPRFPIVYP